MPHRQFKGHGDITWEVWSTVTNGQTGDKWTLGYAARGANKQD